MNNFNLGPLHFQTNIFVLVFVVIVLIATAGLCVTAVRRSARPGRTGILETIRFVCVLFVSIMLLGPEWRTIQESDLQPEIVIVTDESLSMSTTDARVPEAMESEETVITREKLVDNLLASEFWKPFEAEGKNRVTLSTFGAPPGSFHPNTELEPITSSGHEVVTSALSWRG